MSTFASDRSSADFPSFNPNGSGILCRSFGTIQISANPVDSDIYQMCRVPKDSIVTGGWFRLADIDTGTETLEMDIGWADNGVDDGNSIGLGVFGILTGDAVTGYKPELGTIMPFGGVLISDGTKTFGAETIIQVKTDTTAATFVSGQITVLVDYIRT